MQRNENATSNALALAERFSMSGRRALVTGGSVSIGREIVLAFAEAGADIAIHYSSVADAAFGMPNAASDLVAQVQQLGRKAISVEADFEIAKQARGCVEKSEKLLGPIDVLVVCASIQFRTPFLDIQPEQAERQIQINFRATLELLQAALPGMKERGWGRVVTIGSINQTKPESDLVVYAALKCAQSNLARNLAKDYAAYGLTINNLSPGLVVTERNRWRRADPAIWCDIERSSSPMQRAGMPREIAGAALLLCSEAGSFITGTDLEVTGGRHL